MSSTFTLYLPLYDKAYRFDINKFRNAFPNSLITNTLELSKDTDIKITEPFVTPKVIDILYYYAMDEHLPYIRTESYRNDLAKSGDYLNITLLQMMGY